MQIGFVGLGKMGKNMVFRLVEHNVDVVAYNRSEQPRIDVANIGVETVENIADMPGMLDTPRVIWMMVSAGDVVDGMIDALLPYLEKGDLLIDGGNSFYKDTKRRAERVVKTGVRFMDVGVSGGPNGALNGACLMVGGRRSDFDELKPLFEILAAPNAYAYLGDHGAGHFVKMVHNGIEYGMMGAIAEGAAVLKKSEYGLDLTEVFRIYNNQSVITSRLIGWAESALVDDPELSTTSSKIGHTGEGEWTINAAKELGVEVPVIESSYQVRLQSAADSHNFR
ncbi:NADP-dependent phosphogluconate dehydrogenase, partial [candidate division WWE3 bacterium]|nr:NADP-dependent phosphogluconate dehydrogenase [candidate division WWE3 bacterium]